MYKYRVWEFGNQLVAILSADYDDDYYVGGFNNYEDAEQDAYSNVVDMLDRFKEDESYDGSTIDDYSIELVEY